jgi:ribulose-phosphate 3-epimerase
MSVRIAPSLLSADFTRLGEEIRIIDEAGADMLHLDVMDGHFVPNLTMGPGIVAAARRVTRLPLDVHLMITDPDRYLEAFVQAGASMISVHVEVLPHLHRTIAAIHELGCRAGVAINPATSPVFLEDIAADLDHVLVMSVNPGFGGQSFIPRSESKVRTVRGLLQKTGSRAVIEIDGGIDIHTAGRVVAAGADILVAGAAVFGQPDPGAALRALRSAASVQPTA